MIEFIALRAAMEGAEEILRYQQLADRLAQQNHLNAILGQGMAASQQLGAANHQNNFAQACRAIADGTVGQDFDADGRREKLLLLCP